MLAASLVFWTSCTVGLELLGTFGAIDLPHMLAWAATVFAVGLVAAVERTGRSLGSHRQAGAGGLRSGGMRSSACAWRLPPSDEPRVIPSLFMAVKVVSDGPIYHLYFAARCGRPAGSPGGCPVRRECGDLFPRQRRPLVHLADGIMGRGIRCQGRSGPVPDLGGSGVRCARSLGAGRWPASSRPVVRHRDSLFLYSFEPNVTRSS